MELFPIPDTGDVQEEPHRDHGGEGMTLDKGKCTQCGQKFVDYDTNYSNGSVKLCPKCFDEYSKIHPIIIQHCPGCVENGGDYRFYDWNGLEQFVKDEEPGEGYEWKFSYDTYLGEYNCHIMADRKNPARWWVVWIVRDERIVKELLKKMPRWKYHRF